MTDLTVSLIDDTRAKVVDRRHHGPGVRLGARLTLAGMMWCASWFAGDGPSTASI